MEKNISVAVSARGTSWGLATLWYDENFMFQGSYSTQHWILTKLQHLSSKISLPLFNIYVPVNYVEKKVYWKSLSEFMEIHSPLNIIVAGDLNIIFDPKEKKRRCPGKGFF